MEKNIKTAGVSLIEVMISMVLISLLLMAVASVFPRMSSHRKGIQESDIAKVIAAETLEYLQNYSAVDGQGCSDVPTPDLSRNLIVNDQSPYFKRVIGAATYTINWNNGANPCAAAPSATYPVTVTVTWIKQGKTHRITLTGTVK